MWLYNGSTTSDIGLTGSEYTRGDGYKYSWAYEVDEAGRVRGFSYRYNGGLGQSAWLYNGTSTTEIGLGGSEHTRDDGYQYIDAQGGMNDAGQVLGFSKRFNGGHTDLGQDAWFYDPAHNQTFELQLSSRTDGYAYSQAYYLGEDGLAVGTYRLFDALDNDLGERAFSFTIAGGLHDLGALVDGGLTANGWDALATAVRADPMGEIVGWGKLLSQSSGQMTYLLTPVPEPSTLALIGFGALLLGNVFYNRKTIRFRPMPAVLCGSNPGGSHMPHFAF
jgi:hypothetical protein